MNRPQLKSVGERQEAALVIAIGGVDPSGGAGVVRDALTASALGVRLHVVGTAWTEQGDGVHLVEPRAPAALENAVRHAVGLGPAAVKVGMVPDPAAVEALVRGLEGFAGPVVVDPVLASSRGGVLYAGSPGELLPLLRRATLVTPNAPEAAALAGGPAVTDVAAAEAAAHLLLARGLAAVLVKGGHLDYRPTLVTDLLVIAGGTPRRFEHARVPGRSPRGTGCALGTAIAAGLGRGQPLAEAIEGATAWLVRAIAAADEHGHLPASLPEPEGA